MIDRRTWRRDATDVWHVWHRGAPPPPDGAEFLDDEESNEIWIRCEGSGCPTHPGTTAREGVCTMCGHLVGVGADGMAVEHQRDDILARLSRGDFG